MEKYLYKYNKNLLPIISMSHRSHHSCVKKKLKKIKTNKLVPFSAKYGMPANYKFYLCATQLYVL